MLRSSLRSAVAIGSLLASVSAFADSGWGDNNWGDDNNYNRQTPTLDPYDTYNASGYIQGDTYYVNVPGVGTANYVRLCDIVTSVTLETNGVKMREKFYLAKKVLRPNRDINVDVEYYEADSPGFKFLTQSHTVKSSCLRWKNGGDPNQVDPKNKPEQRPGQMPNQVCNPEQDSRGCGNTCRANPRNPRQCESTSNPWGGW